MYCEADLVSIAKRENNKKRSYVVVNRLQGKHIPVSPKEALSMFGALADMLQKAYDTEKLLVIGFAETATAIGAAAAVRLNAYYMQTTRENIKGAACLYFSEEHSHATVQKLVKDDLDKIISEVDRIIFAEDEVTTGKTILNIVRILEQEYPGQVSYAAASILNGMDEEALRVYKEKNIDLHYLVKTDHAAYAGIAGQYTKKGRYIRCIEGRSTLQSDARQIGYGSDSGQNAHTATEPTEGRKTAEDRESAEDREQTEDRESAEGREQTEGRESAEGREQTEDRESAEGREQLEGRESAEGREQLEGRESAEGREPEQGKEPAAGKKPAEVREYRVNGWMDARRLVSASEYEQACLQLWQKADGLLHEACRGRVLVLGTEEFMYPALVSAAQIAHGAREVRFHATTRSPIEVYDECGYPLHVRYELCSLYDKNRRTFVYDIGAYDAVLIMTDAHNEEHEGMDSLIRAAAQENQNIYIVRWC